MRNAALRAHMRTPPLVRVVRTDEAQCDGETRAEDAAGTLLWAAVRVRGPSTADSAKARQTALCATDS